VVLMSHAPNANLLALSRSHANTLRDSADWASVGLLTRLADALEQSEKRRKAALALLDTVYGADLDILNGRPEMDAAEEKALALRLLRDHLTREKEL